ncbi:MAG: hypothetical protein ACYTDX_07725, partial [Planctomycetota bacterium]
MRPAVLLAAGLLFTGLALPTVCLAPVEVEPNDAPTDEAFAGFVNLPAPGADHEITGEVADDEDVDWFRLSTTEASDAIVLLQDFQPPLTLQGRHDPVIPDDRTSSTYPFAFRAIFGWPAIQEGGTADNFVAVSGSQEEDANSYSLRIVRPGYDAFKATVKLVDKAAEAKDSFKVKLTHVADPDLQPGTSGFVRVRLRDYVEDLPLASFKPNGPGTKLKYKGSSGGVTKLVWNL